MLLLAEPLGKKQTNKASVFFSVHAPAGLDDGLIRQEMFPAGTGRLLRHSTDSSLNHDACFSLFRSNMNNANVSPLVFFFRVKSPTSTTVSTLWIPNFLLLSSFKISQ